MIEVIFTVGFFIKRFASDTLPEQTRRQRYGLICGAAGIFFNIVLFFLKLVVGMISASISITADAFNNLSDAGSAAVSLGGFWLSGRGADDEHPFGHGRIEYISGLLVSLVITIVGAQLLKSSVEKIFSPAKFEFSGYVVAILAISVIVKLYMAFYNKRCAAEISSPILSAAAADSISDTAATGAILVSTLFTYFTDINVDGFIGAAVSLLIIKTGIDSFIETAAPLLGKPAPPETVEKIKHIVTNNPETVGMHDLVIHDYGPGRAFVSLHMEVDGSHDMYVLHDAVELAEQTLSRELGCEAVIHMDPIDVGNPVLKELYAAVCEKAVAINPSITVHDMRMVPGAVRTNVIFDVAVPPSLLSESENISRELCACLTELDPCYNAVIKVERIYS